MLAPIDKKLKPRDVLNKNIMLAIMALWGSSLIFFHPLRTFPISINFSLSVVFIVIYFTFGLIRKKITRVFVKSLIFSLCWLAIPVVTSFSVYASQYHHFRSIVIACFYSLAGLIFSEVVTSKKKIFLRVFYTILIIGCAINGIFFLLYLFFDVNISPGVEFSGIFSNRNYLTFSLLKGMIPVVVYFGDLSGRQKKIAIICIFLSSIMILVSHSFSGFSSLLILLTSLVLLMRRGYLLKVFFLITILFVLLGSYKIDTFRERVEKFINVSLGHTEGLDASSPAKRLWMIREGLAYILEKPFTPLGLDNERFYFYHPSMSSDILNSREGEGTHLHSNYLALGVGGGVLSLFFYYVPAVIILLISLCRLHVNRNFLLISLILTHQLWIDLFNSGYRDIPSIVFRSLVFYLFFKEVKWKNKS